MSVQDARHANLRAIIAKLEAEGLTDLASQVAALGPSLTVSRLQQMLAGGEMNVFMARAIEHYLRKPKNWMDVPHDDVGDVTPFNR